MSMERQTVKRFMCDRCDYRHEVDEFSEPVGWSTGSTVVNGTAFTHLCPKCIASFAAWWEAGYTAAKPAPGITGL